MLRIRLLQHLGLLGPLLRLHARVEDWATQATPARPVAVVRVRTASRAD